jgi:hypothetical protein
MDLGTRQIRTAGRGSGSVELTLPGALRQFVGLRCRITLHDGARPDIVLRPDLSPALREFAAIWHALHGVFTAEAWQEDGPFPADSFDFSLLPKPGAPGAPVLCWQDGLALAMPPDPGPGPAGRSIAACATQLAAELGIAPGLGIAFGAACGFLAAGDMLFAAWQEPSDIVSSVLAARRGEAPVPWQPGEALRAAANRPCAALWDDIAPGLAFCASLFAGWSAPESRYPDLRAAWRRGHAIEMTRG